MRRYYPGITDKRLCNRRFCKTEEAILKAFFDDNNYISIEKMAKKAGVARSTFYHHHQTVNKIIIDYRNYILSKYGQMIKKTSVSRETAIKILYERTIIFIIQYQRIFKILMMGNEREIFNRMIIKLGPKLIPVMGLPKNYEKIFLVYTGEIVALLGAWCKGGAKKNEIDALLGEIVFLTKTARVRLKILL